MTFKFTNVKILLSIINKKLKNMRYKFLVIGVAFSVLFSCFISVKAQAQTLSFTPTNSSCNLQSLSSCDRNDLIMLLIQLILQTMNQPVVETLPDLYVGDIQYENGKMAIKIMNQGGVIDLCKENIYVEVANLNAGVWLTYPLRCENKEQLIDINNPFLYRLNIYNSLKVEEGHNLSVKLDYHNTIKESNENNNELKTTFNTYKNYENKVLYPTAGIFISSNIDIKWQGAKDTRHIIEVVSENGTGWHLSYDAKTDSNGFGKFIWDINSLGTEYGKFKIRIESQDATNKYSIDSGYFTIEEDVVEKILYPT
ncbi:MAG: hypothetical protein PHS00_00720, partial [Candidatus Pacebacteria bacterium]|nr:hypothetical protein [Candidatus Paceibacterota bacterium]